MGGENKDLMPNQYIKSRRVLRIAYAVDYMKIISKA